MIRLLIPLSVVAIVFGAINTLAIALTDQLLVPGHRWHFLDPVLVFATSFPVGIFAAIFWLRGILAKRTTIRHGGFVGFYAFLVTLVNPASWVLYLGSFLVGFLYTMTLLLLLGLLCGRAIGAVFPSIRLDRPRVKRSAADSASHTGRT